MSAVLKAEWNEADHPREPAGTSEGGQFISSAGFNELSLISTGRFPTSLNPILRDAINELRYLDYKKEMSLDDGKNLLKEDIGADVIAELRTFHSDSRFITDQPIKAFFGGTYKTTGDDKLTFGGARYLTMDRSRAERYAGEHGKVFEVELPKGTRAAIGAVQGYQEIILQPGSSFSVSGNKATLLDDGTSKVARLLSYIDDIDKELSIRKVSLAVITKAHTRPKYTGFETRQYVLAHEGKLRTVIARLLADLGERIAREILVEKVSLGALLKAEWNEEDHPRDEDGKFTDGGGGDDELNAHLIKEAGKKIKEKGLRASTVAYAINAPLRRTEEGMQEARQVLRTAGDYDAVERVLGSQVMWEQEGGWATAVDEWEAAQRLGGNGVTSKTTKDEFKRDSSRTALNDKELSGFKARREWMQQKFREVHGDEVEVYRGVKGAYAKKLPESGEVDLPSYALSSWSLSSTDAREFSGKTGRVIKTKIKAEDVWLLPATGVRSPHTIADAGNEVVVLNTGKTRRATVL